ncbi:hypothetical protein [Trebonia sp.]|uniref:hypothetical protein n=1 Tax=Trebonia sp. TaxID=2767075 RepID=UPI002639200A|nr:hypothetical protein [Trebonia sp.]
MVAGTFRAAAACVATWLTGLLRRAGDRLFAMNDAEAGWRGWQVTVLNGGLARQYRDGGFDTLCNPGGRPPEAPRHGRAPAAPSPPGGER